MEVIMKGGLIKEIINYIKNVKGLDKVFFEATPIMMKVKIDRLDKGKVLKGKIWIDFISYFEGYCFVEDLIKLEGRIEDDDLVMLEFKELNFCGTMFWGVENIQIYKRKKEVIRKWI